MIDWQTDSHTHGLNLSTDWLNDWLIDKPTHLRPSVYWSSPHNPAVGWTPTCRTLHGFGLERFLRVEIPWDIQQNMTACVGESNIGTGIMRKYHAKGIFVLWINIIQLIHKTFVYSPKSEHFALTATALLSKSVLLLYIGGFQILTHESWGVVSWQKDIWVIH